MILACPVLCPSAGLATMQVTAHGRGFRHPQPWETTITGHLTVSRIASGHAGGAGLGGAIA